MDLDSMDICRLKHTLEHFIRHLKSRLKDIQLLGIFTAVTCALIQTLNKYTI